ncbi:MAG: hypothetical protein HQM12_03130 [SAR324 cluster bacterium]|nr:hypothetical protein [SAR324 cluster bacterium]
MEVRSWEHLLHHRSDKYTHRIYSLRSKIEVLFRVLRKHIGAYLYRFWTLACPKRSQKKQAAAATEMLGPKASFFTALPAQEKPSLPKPSPQP